MRLTGRPSDHQVKEIRERIRTPTGKTAVEAFQRAIDKYDGVPHEAPPLTPPILQAITSTWANAGLPVGPWVIARQSVQGFVRKRLPDVGSSDCFSFIKESDDLSAEHDHPEPEPGNVLTNPDDQKA